MSNADASLGALTKARPNTNIKNIVKFILFFC
jgi:hypothetical protein